MREYFDADRYHELKESLGTWTAQEQVIREELLKAVMKAKTESDIESLCDILYFVINTKFR